MSIPFPLSLHLRHGFAVAVVGFVTLIAYLNARAFSHLLAAALTLPGHSRLLSRIRELAPNDTPISLYAHDAILPPNAFDSKLRQLGVDLLHIPAPQPPRPPADPLAIAQCPGIQASLVTESRNPNWSAAALQGPGESTPRLVHLGDNVADKRVAFIGYNPRYQSPAVWLVSDRSMCQTLLFAPPPPVASAVAAPASPAATPAPPPGGPRLPTEIASRIQRVNGGEYRIERAAVERILSDQELLFRSVRVVPENQNGKQIGIRVFGIRPGTLLDAIGLSNGDRLESINGFDMTSPEKVLELYMRLRTAENLKVQFNRGGKAMTLDYRIQ